MEVKYAPRVSRGVTQLAYVGDVEEKPISLLLLLAIAGAAWLALKK
jgi:hypothetical protein